jgi:hypothetical protein
VMVVVVIVNVNDYNIQTLDFNVYKYTNRIKILL